MELSFWKKRRKREITQSVKRKAQHAQGLAFLVSVFSLGTRWGSLSLCLLRLSAYTEREGAKGEHLKLTFFL